MAFAEVLTDDELETADRQQDGDGSSGRYGAGMRDTLVAGLEGTAVHIVTADMAPGHLPMVVLSTPSMVGLIEGCCLMTAQAHLDDGETTVGTHVCVSHTGALTEGERFEVRVRLVEVVKRRLNFEVMVIGERGPISEGTHQRAVVSLNRMT